LLLPPSRSPRSRGPWFATRVRRDAWWKSQGESRIAWVSKLMWDHG
jgi:hypothetical protein